MVVNYYNLTPSPASLKEWFLENGTIELGSLKTLADLTRVFRKARIAELTGVGELEWRADFIYEIDVGPVHVRLQVLLILKLSRPTVT